MCPTSAEKMRRENGMCFRSNAAFGNETKFGVASKVVGGHASPPKSEFVSTEGKSKATNKFACVFSCLRFGAVLQRNERDATSLWVPSF